MTNLFVTVLNMSVTAAFVIAALCAARLVLQKLRAPKWISYALWAVAGLNLASPFKLESAFSLIPFNSKPIPQDIAMQAIPRINSGIGVIDNAVSSSLPAAATAASVNPLQIWTALGAYVWLFGVAAMLIYAVISYVRLVRRKDSVTTPFVYGFIKPKIHIPSGIEGEKLRYVTLHEQTHIKRRDHLVKLFAFALLCVHWFNPLAWAAFVLLCADMEMSCDERVLRELGMSVKADYSQTLLSLSMNRRILGASPLAFGEGGVKERVKNVLNFKKRSRVIIVAAIALVAIISVGFAVNRAAKIRTIETTRVFELEAATERDLFEKLITVSLNPNGAAILQTPFISSYLQTNCTYEIEGDAVYIYESRPDSAEKSLAAVFDYEGDDTLVFRSSDVPVFADKGARYVCDNLPRVYAVVPESGLTALVSFKRFSYTDATKAVDTIAPWDAAWYFGNTVYTEPRTKLDLTFMVNPTYGAVTAIEGYEINTSNGEVYESGQLTGESIVTPAEPGEYFYSIRVRFEKGLNAFYAVKMVVENAGSSTASTNEADYLQRLQDGIEHESFDGFNVGGTSESEVKRIMGREPDGMLSGFWGDVYLLGDGTELIFYYDANGIVSRILQKSVMDEGKTPPIETVPRELLSSWTALEDLPTDYGKEQAAKDGVYVNVHGTEIFNLAALIGFYSAIESDAPQQAFVRTMLYTVEGDPIITDYQYDGEKYIVTLDTTRDKFGAQTIERLTFNYLVKYTPPANSGYTGSEPLRLFSNTPTITDADWERVGYYELLPLPATSAAAILGIDVDKGKMFLNTDMIDKVVVEHTQNGQPRRIGLSDAKSVLADWVGGLQLKYINLALSAEIAPIDIVGDEVWSFDVNGIKGLFSYGSYGGGYYLHYNREWYKVQNPSDPPINEGY
ncbi:hypothetical protein FACS189425_02830 [Clostridia bacterium]|nr:hypothetical protein FACS189425_02830 [Clostridia bacterium]